jgi:hypothetical protein
VPVTPARPSRQTVENSEDEKVAQQKSLQPIIIDGIAASYVNDKRNDRAFLAEVEGVRLGRANRFFRGSMYGLVNGYQAAGITDLIDINSVLIWTKSSGNTTVSTRQKSCLWKSEPFPKGDLSRGHGKLVVSEFDAPKMGWKRVSNHSVS